jgi:hypothetical protein
VGIRPSSLISAADMGNSNLLNALLVKNAKPKSKPVKVAIHADVMESASSRGTALKTLRIPVSRLWAHAMHELSSTVSQERW